MPGLSPWALHPPWMGTLSWTHRARGWGKGWTVLPDPEPHGPKPAVPQHPRLPNSAATVKHSHERAPVAGPQVSPKLGHGGCERHGPGGGMAGSSRTGCSQTPCPAPGLEPLSARRHPSLRPVLRDTRSYRPSLRVSPEVHTDLPYLFLQFLYLSLLGFYSFF